MSLPRVGEIVDGFRFLGGEPDSEQSWEPAQPRAGDVMDGYRFKGGDPNSESAWEPATPPKRGFLESLRTPNPAPPPADEARDEFSVMRDQAASAPEPATGSVIDRIRPPAFNPIANPADALALESAAGKASRETLTGPMRPGPTIEAAQQLDRDTTIAQARAAAPDIRRAHAAAKAVDAYKDGEAWTEQHPVFSSISSGIAQGISSTGDFLWMQAQEAQRKIDEGLNPAAPDPYFSDPTMRGFSAVAGTIQEGLRRLLPADDKGTPKRLQWASDLDEASKLLKPDIANLSFTDAERSGQLMKWLVVQGGEQSPNHAMILATILAPSLAPLTLPAMGAQSAGNQYAEDRAAKVGHNEAYLDATFNGAIEAAGEGLSVIFGGIGSKAVTSALRAVPAAQREAAATAILGKALRSTGVLAGTAISEGVSEGATQVGQDLSQLYFAGRDPGDMAENAKTAAAIGAFMGGVTTGAAVGANALARGPQPEQPKPERTPDPLDVAAPILEANTVDEAIAAAEAALNGPSEAPLAASPITDQTGTGVLTTATSPQYLTPTPTVPEAPAPEAQPAPESALQAPSDPVEQPQQAEAPASAEEPLQARSPAEMTTRELDAILRLTRSPDRRAEIAAEIVRRGQAQEQAPQGIIVPESTKEPSDAVQERSAAALPVRDESQGGEGVRVENAQGQEAAGARQGNHQPGAQEVTVPAAEAAETDGGFTNSTSRTASWVIREKATGKVVMETFDPKKVEALNTAKYEAVPIQEYLASLSKRPIAAPAVRSEAAQVAQFRDYAAPKADRARGIAKGQVRTFKTEKSAATFAKQQKLRGYTPRQSEGEWVLSKPERPRTAAQRANDASLRSQAKSIRSTDDLLTTIHKAGGILMREVDGADPVSMQEANRQGFGKPFRKNRGLTADGLAETLAQHGWDVLDESGRPDATKALELVHQALAGEKLYTPEGYEAQAAKQPQPDQRVDLERRKAVAQMTPEEMRRELLTSEKAGIANERAYKEAPKKAIQAYIDLDGLGWVNDNMGHDAGDKLVAAIGQALREESIEGYHLHGDEFAAQFDTEDDGHEAIALARERLRNAEITVELPDGSRITKTGVEFSYGLGQDLATADRGLLANKAERESLRLRAPKGQQPPGVAREPAAGEQDRGRETPAAQEPSAPEPAAAERGRDEEVAPASAPRPIPEAQQTPSPEGVSVSEPSIDDAPPALLDRVTVPIERFHEGEGVKTEQVPAQEALAEHNAEISVFEKLLECLRQ